jgi:phosphatidylethanolamine-binding protein
MISRRLVCTLSRQAGVPHLLRTASAFILLSTLVASTSAIDVNEMSRRSAATLSVDAAGASAGSGKSMMPKEGASGPVSPSLLRHLFEGGDILPEFSPSIPLGVSYGSHAADFGNQYELREVPKAPSIHFTGLPGESYTILMMDPDAPGPKEPAMRNWLHWIVENIPSNGDVSAGHVVTSYAPPTPPKGNHRYVLLLCQQQRGVKMAAENPPGRGKFSAIDFIGRHSLKPVGINYFMVHAHEFKR